jgi:hypothetical protein
LACAKIVSEACCEPPPHRPSCEENSVHRIHRRSMVGRPRRAAINA